MFFPNEAQFNIWWYAPVMFIKIDKSRNICQKYLLALLDTSLWCIPNENIQKVSRVEFTSAPINTRIIHTFSSWNYRFRLATINILRTGIVSDL